MRGKRVRNRICFWWGAGGESCIYIYINRLVVQVLVNYFVEECVGVILWYLVYITEKIFGFAIISSLLLLLLFFVKSSWEVISRYKISWRVEVLHSSTLFCYLCIVSCYSKIRLFLNTCFKKKRKIHGIEELLSLQLSRNQLFNTVLLWHLFFAFKFMRVPGQFSRASCLKVYFTRPTFFSKRVLPATRSLPSTLQVLLRIQNRRESTAFSTAIFPIPESTE